MPRTARKKSATGIYHIMVRGINRQEIFQDEEDKSAYLDRVSKYKLECDFEIYAYCLMNNHVHLLIKEGKEAIQQIMKKIGTSYVYWYNFKYGRVGHLFQDRYKSEAVENDRYLLTVARYIHQNPVKVGLKMEEWTSYNDYFGDAKITDTEMLLEMFNNNPAKYKEYMNEKNGDTCLDISEGIRLTDIEAKEIIIKMVGIENLQNLQTMDKKTRNSILKELKQEGLSIRQIERITGVNRGTVLGA